MKKLILVLVASACCSAFTINASAQQADQAISDAVIAMAKAQWAAAIKKSDERRCTDKGHVG